MHASAGVIATLRDVRAGVTRIGELRSIRRDRRAALGKWKLIERDEEEGETATSCDRGVCLRDADDGKYSRRNARTPRGGDSQGFVLTGMRREAAFTWTHGSPGTI